MHTKPDSVSAIRVYVFDYIVGVLWLRAFITAVSGRRGPQLFGAINRKLEAMSTLKAPDLVIGFLLTPGGVILPYYIAVILKPVTLNVIRSLQRRQRAIRRWLVRHSNSSPQNDGPSLEQLAKDHVYEEAAGAAKADRHVVAHQLVFTFS